MKRLMARARRASHLRSITAATRRRCLLGGVYMALAAGILAAAWPAWGQATTAPSAVAEAKTHFQKAKDLYNSGQYAEARNENKQALALDPHNSQAVLLAKVLAEKLASSSGETDTGEKSGTAAMPVLNAQQISTIRLAELSPNERVLRGKIDRNTLEDFWDNVLAKDQNNPNTSPAAKTAFLNPGNFAAQVRAIKGSGNARYMDQVVLTSDPSDIVSNPFSFLNVQTYMLQNCATSACHGGDKAGDFRLIPNGVAGVTVEQQRYTNFYIMSTYKNAAGKMIDRDTPDKSLFIAYGLPHGHPNVTIPTKLQVGDVQYRRMIDWIKSLAFPQPNYGIAYDVPGNSKTTATAPKSGQ